MNGVYRLLRYNRIVKNHRIKFATLLAADILGFRYLSVRIDPVIDCNIRCQMCRFSNEDWRKSNYAILKKEEVDRIAEMLFPKAVQLVIGCEAEPTLYKNYIDILATGKKYGIPYVSFVTNAQLLKEEHVDRMITHKLDELVISTHGVKKETYEKLMVGASFDKLLKALETIESVKKRRNSAIPILRINYTVNQENLDELKGFFAVFGRYDAKVLQVRPIVDLGNIAYPHKDLSNTLSEYGKIIGQLAAECKQRGLIFLANTADPTFSSASPAASISDEVLRYVSPRRFWKDDFDWRNESYKAYCRRIGWRWHLIKATLMSARDVNKWNTRMAYDIHL
ncbi:MAG: radical SAM protein [Pseudomonadota bacterium]